MTSVFIDQKIYLYVKPWPNDRNMPTQHIATLLGATCCVRLTTLLHCVATCWALLAQNWHVAILWPGLYSG